MPPPDDCLTPRQAQVVDMRVDGLNNQQIARVLGISRTAVKRRMQRARLALATEDLEWDRRDGK